MCAFCDFRFIFICIISSPVPFISFSLFALIANQYNTIYLCTISSSFTYQYTRVFLFLFLYPTHSFSIFIYSINFFCFFVKLPDERTRQSLCATLVSLYIKWFLSVMTNNSVFQYSYTHDFSLVVSWVVCTKFHFVIPPKIQSFEMKNKNFFKCDKNLSLFMTMFEFMYVFGERAV